MKLKNSIKANIFMKTFIYRIGYVWIPYQTGSLLTFEFRFDHNKLYWNCSDIWKELAGQQECLTLVYCFGYFVTFVFQSEVGWVLLYLEAKYLHLMYLALHLSSAWRWGMLESIRSLIMPGHALTEEVFLEL